MALIFTYSAEWRFLKYPDKTSCCTSTSNIHLAGNETEANLHGAVSNFFLPEFTGLHLPLPQTFTVAKIMDSTDTTLLTATARLRDGRAGQLPRKPN
jgi:hypothetical protein